MIVANADRRSRFSRDVKLAQKRAKDMAKLREVILLLIDGTPLPARYKDRSLGGERSRNTFGFVLNAPVATNM